jgi:hypothetical protein
MAMFKREVLVDHIGSYRTQSLFLEINNSSLSPIMTLKELDWEYKGKLLPSLKKIYLELEDPTEYEVAMHVLGSWNHWNRLLDNKLIRTEIIKWREELEIKLRSKALRAMIDTASFEGAKGTTAAKYLAEKGWIKRPAGRPSEEETKGQLKQDKELKELLKEDAKRVGLH